MKKILIEMRHGYGDLVHLIPTLVLLKKNNYQIDIILKSKEHYNLIENLGLVENYFILDSLKKNYIQIIKMIIKLRKNNYFCGIISPITTKWLGVILMKILRIKKIIYNREKNEEKFHRVDLNIKLLKQLGIQHFNKINPILKVENNIYISTLNILKKQNSKIINIVVGANQLSIKKYLIFNKKIDCKNWGIGNYVKLAKLLSNNGYSIILTGILDKDKVKILEKLEGKNIINLINKTTLDEANQISNISDLIVGNDTGNIHIADALGKKTLTLFGPTNPKIIGAYSQKAKYITLNLDCQYCYGKVEMINCRNRKCLKNIKVNLVYKKINEILEEEK